MSSCYLKDWEKDALASFTCVIFTSLKECVLLSLKEFAVLEHNLLEFLEASGPSLGLLYFFAVLIELRLNSTLGVLRPG